MADLAQRAFFLLVVRPFLVLFIGLRVRGRENLPAKGPFVLVANHTSHLDTVTLLSLVPARRLAEIRPVAAADYFERNAVVAFLSRTLFNILPIVRTRAEVTEENDPRRVMREALDAGDSLILFPEGTRRSTAEEAGHFKAGVAHLVETHPDVPVVPAFLLNTGRSLPKGTFVPVPFFCEVRIGAPVFPIGTRAEIVTALEAAVNALRDETPKAG